MVQPTASALQQFPLMKHFERDEMEILAPLFERARYPTGTFLIREGGEDDDLFLLEEGHIEVWLRENGVDHPIAELPEKSVFGEMAFLDGEKRSTSIRAKDDVTVLRLSRKRFDGLGIELEKMRFKFLAYLSQSTLHKLRYSNQKTIEERDKRDRFGFFVIIMVMAFSLVACVAGFGDDIKRVIPTYILSLVMCSATMALCFFGVRLVKLPLSEFGFTLRRWKRSTVEGVVVASVLLVGFHFYLPQYNIAGLYMELFLYGYKGWIYIIVVILQQVIFRGVLQTALENFYQRRTIAIVVSSIAFSVSHAYLGAAATVGALFMGLFLGAIYAHQRDLVGISIVHYALGSIGMALKFVPV